jgi:hypothetical protein
MPTFCPAHEDKRVLAENPLLTVRGHSGSERVRSWFHSLPPFQTKKEVVAQIKEANWIEGSCDCTVP